MLDIIKKLADNFIIKEKSKDIDIVIEGGFLNGLYSLGALLLIKELENRKYFNVHRISGASVGSIMGFAYLSDSLLDIPNYFKKARYHFKKNMNLLIIKNIIEDHCISLTNEKFNFLKKDKLYISYTKNGIKKIRYRYKNKKELLDSILKSIHVPYLITGNYYHICGDNKYLDGGQPYIFNNRDTNDLRKILYLDNSNILTMFSAKSELNCHGRILEGALQCYNYLLKEKKGFLCSYLHKWNMYDYMCLRLKQISCFIIMYFVFFIEKYGSIIFSSLYKTEIYKMIKSFCKQCIIDFILYKFL
tara:strand:- start:2120 stop:3028 length:909 start_codon:yes stop_codon:yes gene_type:complete